MTEMADILRARGPHYMASYGHRMPPSHKRAIEDITLCRTPPMGGNVYWCNPCNDYRYSYHSCKNRNCPKCGNDDATRWLAAQQALLLPVPYFLVTSTLPQQLRPLARSNQKLFYGLLLRLTAQAIQKLALDPQWVGGDIGLVGVVQTWARDMGYHVHTHFIVPAGGISPDGKRWMPAQRTYLMPEKAVAQILRATFRDALKKHPDLFKLVPAHVWHTSWIVNIKPVGKGTSALKYLAPYIFRVAISNKRINRFDGDSVTFSYKNAHDQSRPMTLNTEEFIRRFLQHVLPYRFIKVRYYGFLNPKKRLLLDTIKKLFSLFKADQNIAGPGCLRPVKVRVMHCPKCGSEMVLIYNIKPQRWRAPP